MAVSTANTILKYKNGDSLDFEKLVDIKEYPDMGSEPEKIDTTDLSATRFKTSILGLQDAPDLTFTANYTKEGYEKITAIKGECEFRLELGEDGVDGIFEWTGEIDVYLTGGSVDEVREMTIITNASDEIRFVEA